MRDQDDLRMLLDEIYNRGFESRGRFDRYDISNQEFMAALNQAEHILQIAYDIEPESVDRIYNVIEEEYRLGKSLAERIVEGPVVIPTDPYGQGRGTFIDPRSPENLGLNLSPVISSVTFGKNDYVEIPTQTSDPKRPRTVAAAYMPADPKDPDSYGIMTIVFRDGTFWNYYDVSEAEWRQFRDASSKGYALIRFGFDNKLNGPADMAKVPEAVRYVLWQSARMAQMALRGNATPSGKDFRTTKKGTIAQKGGGSGAVRKTIRTAKQVERQNKKWTTRRAKNR